MKKLELNQMENLEGGKFWGWLQFAHIGPCQDGVIIVTHDYYVFGFVVDSQDVKYPC